MTHLNQTDIAKEFQQFLDFVRGKAGGDFTGFDHAYVHTEEGYKGPLGEKAREELQLDTWRPELIGTGHIKQAVIRSFATHIQWAGKQHPNNLVHWQQVKPFEALPNAEVEAVVYELHKGTASPAVVYERMRDAGVSYQITAFLFFLKDPERYLPITQERFDQAFRLLGEKGFRTSHAKGWENYATFLDLIGQVRTFLIEKLKTPVSLLDAHSFVYMIASQMQWRELDRSAVDREVAAFQREWPLERVRRMTLAEYAQQKGDKNSFCHWVAQRTKSAGHLGNAFPAATYGIYHRDPKNTDGKAGLHEEGPYLWAEGLAYATAEEVFEEVRSRIVATIKAAQADDLEAISRINGMDLFRWKVAYLYAPDKVVPIYNREHLKAAARELGMPNYQQASYAARHRYILANLPDGMNAFSYMHAFYERNRVEPERGVKYWVVGSSYKDPGKPRYNIFPSMLKEEGVAIGYLWGEDLGSYYLDDTQDVKPLIDQYYTRNKQEGKQSAQMAVSKFLRIASGDIVAIKGRSNYTKREITILGYARIVERDGGAYRMNTEDGGEGLGHVLNAEFLVDDIDRLVHTTLPHTVHEVDPVKDRKRWELIFGALESQWAAEERSNERAASDQLSGTSDRRAGTNTLNVESYFVGGSPDGRWVRPYHKEMQNSLLASLKAQFKNDRSTKLEEDYIDLLRIDQDGGYHLYELKTDGSPMKCIRQALGQLLAYAALKKKEAKEIKLYVVGPQVEDLKAEKFKSYLRESHGLVLEYIALQPKLE